VIRRVLIANRGEIARRVIRTCRAMDIATVAIFSDADAHAPYTREADEAVHIGPAAAVESYLNIPHVIEAATRAGADAIHPGYGFLSENPAFAEACEAAGLTFIGPPAAVMRRMGSKTGARALVSAAGVPVVPGASPKSQTDADLAEAVTATGYPALLKAASGGGGKGMRIVRDSENLTEAIAGARGEAARAFGSGTLYVERLVERARHIEVQIFGDSHGHVVHLFERDCTLQRRHQKVIEESPAPTLTPAVRDRLTRAAVAAARAFGYVNAGTCEFLLEGDGDNASFYFLEMNMRLQVEHPVTEAVTGLDLVRAQILVASGEPLPFQQPDISLGGHAIECRIYAEDSRRLLPQAGRLLRYREPHGPGVRVDGGVEEGQTITVHYDPLLAKLITHGGTRAEAIDRMLAAIRSYEILGLRHNLGFLRNVLEHEAVRANQVHTRFLEEHLTALAADPPADRRRAAAVFAAWMAAKGSTPTPVLDPAESSAQFDPWTLLGSVSW
jgi:acetyl/propionyl-CoA carboxylase alpha subunit